MNGKVKIDSVNFDWLMDMVVSKGCEVDIHIEKDGSDISIRPHVPMKYSSKSDPVDFHPYN